MICLDARLSEIAGFVSPCKTVMDIGSDHGLLPCYLLQNGVAKNVIITDISQKSLNKAKELIKSNNLTESAVFYCTDGFKGVALLPQTVIIAGMGGMEIIQILKDLPQCVENIVLQPMRNTLKLRQYLIENDFCIIADKKVCSCGKFYDIIKTCKGKDSLTEEEIYFGRTNLENKSKVFFDYLIKEKEKLTKIVACTEKSGNKAEDLYNRLEMVMKTINKFY